MMPSNMNEDGTEAGGLTPGGRFARMEASLARIEAKLDAKADRHDVERVEADIQAMKLRIATYDQILVSAAPREQQFMAEHAQVLRDINDLKTTRATTGAVAVTEERQRSLTLQVRLAIFAAIAWPVITSIASLINHGKL